MIGIICQLASMFSFSLSNALWRSPVGRFHYLEAICYRSVFSCLFFIILVLLHGGSINVHQSVFGVNLVVFTITVCLFSFFGLFFYVKAIEGAPTGVVVTTSATTFVFGQLTAFFVLQEQLNNKIIVPILLFALSIILTDIKDARNFKLSKSIVYALLAALFWGTTFPLLSIPARKLGYDVTGLILELSVLTMSLIGVLFIKPDQLHFKPALKNWHIFATLGILAGLGVLFQNITYIKIPVYIAGAISSSSHLLTIMFAFILFREQLNKMQILAALVASMAILVLLNIM